MPRHRRPTHDRARPRVQELPLPGPRRRPAAGPAPAPVLTPTHRTPSADRRSSSPTPPERRRVGMERQTLHTPLSEHGLTTSRRQPAVQPHQAHAPVGEARDKISEPGHRPGTEQPQPVAASPPVPPRDPACASTEHWPQAAPGHDNSQLRSSPGPAPTRWGSPADR